MARRPKTTTTPPTEPKGETSPLVLAEPAQELEAAAAKRTRPVRIGAAAIGALAFGALAIGALAIGRLAIGRLGIGHARLGKLEIDELIVRKLTVLDVSDRD